MLPASSYVKKSISKVVSISYMWLILSVVQCDTGYLPGQRVMHISKRWWRHIKGRRWRNSQPRWSNF